MALRRITRGAGYADETRDAVLREHVRDGSGVRKVRRRERSSTIEVFRVEESGTGDILSQEFVEWRTRGGAKSANGAGSAEGVDGGVLDGEERAVDER